MKVVIYESLCTGCAACSDFAPDVFELTDDMIAVVRNPDSHVPAKLEKMVQEAIESCPVSCIEIDE